MDISLILPDVSENIFVLTAILKRKLAQMPRYSLNFAKATPRNFPLCVNGIHVGRLLYSFVEKNSSDCYLADNEFTTDTESFIFIPFPYKSSSSNLQLWKLASRHHYFSHQNKRRWCEP